MKILLIRYHDRNNINSREVKSIVNRMGTWPPLGLLYIAATLKKHGYKVDLLDVMEQRLDSIDARKKIIDSGADIIGITATTPEIKGVKEVAEFAHNAGAKVVIGGPHLGIFPEETVSFPEVDFAIQGDGEIPFLRLVKALGYSKPDFSTIPGLVYKNNNRIYKNEIYVEQDLKTIPFPDWDSVNIKGYSRADAFKPLATMISARGCPYDCGFCYRGVNGKVMRFRDPVSVVDEMAYLKEKYGIREIIFCNDTLTIQRKHIVAICEEILHRNLKIVWQGATRVDSIDPELLHLMKKAGCKQLKFGIESGNDQILALMRKKITKEKAKEAFKWCKKEGIRIGAYFIIGYANEDKNTIQDTINFAKDLDPDFVMFYAGIPLPSTSFHEIAVKNGQIDQDYWRDYVLGKRDDKVPYLIPEMHKWIRRAFFQFYGRPSFIVKKLFCPDIWLSVIRHPSLIFKLFHPQ